MRTAGFGARRFYCFLLARVLCGVVPEEKLISCCRRDGASESDGHRREVLSSVPFLSVDEARRKRGLLAIFFIVQLVTVFNGGKPGLDFIEL